MYLQICTARSQKLQKSLGIALQGASSLRVSANPLKSTGFSYPAMSKYEMCGSCQKIMNENGSLIGGYERT